MGNAAFGQHCIFGQRCVSLLGGTNLLWGNLRATLGTLWARFGHTLGTFGTLHLLLCVITIVDTLRHLYLLLLGSFGAAFGQPLSSYINEINSQRNNTHTRLSTNVWGQSAGDILPKRLPKGCPEAAQKLSKVSPKAAQKLVHQFGEFWSCNSGWPCAVISRNPQISDSHGSMMSVRLSSHCTQHDSKSGNPNVACARNTVY